MGKREVGVASAFSVLRSTVLTSTDGVESRLRAMHYGSINGPVPHRGHVCVRNVPHARPHTG